MTLGWQTIMEFSPALVGCFITNANHSYELIRKSGECGINIPDFALAKKVIGIGNTSGRDVDKFKEFKLTVVKSKLVDKKFLKKYSFFIFKAVMASSAESPPFPMHDALPRRRKVHDLGPQ